MASIQPRSGGMKLDRGASRVGVGEDRSRVSGNTGFHGDTEAQLYPGCRLLLLHRDYIVVWISIDQLIHRIDACLRR